MSKLKTECLLCAGYGAHHSSIREVSARKCNPFLIKPAEDTALI